MALQRKPEFKIEPAKTSIMIIDDSAFCRNMLCEVLRSLGFIKFMTFKDAPTALSEVPNYQPKIIFSDLEMPPMDGIEFTRRVRHDLQWPLRGTPIIMVSGAGTPERLQEARWAGIDEYVVKPFSVGAIQTRIDEVMKRPRPFIQAPKYTGPCRRRRMIAEGIERKRLTDPFDVAAPEANLALAERKQVIEEGIGKIAEIAHKLQPGDRLQVRAIYKGSMETHDVAVEIQDNLLERATRSLVGYIEGIGANGNVESQVIQTHLAAIQELVRMPHVISKERESVAIGLEKMVHKKLAEAAAA